MTAMLAFSAVGHHRQGYSDLSRNIRLEVGHAFVALSALFAFFARRHSPGKRLLNAGTELASFWQLIA